MIFRFFRLIEETQRQPSGHKFGLHQRFWAFLPMRCCELIGQRKIVPVHHAPDHDLAFFPPCFRFAEIIGRMQENIHRFGIAVIALQPAQMLIKQAGIVLQFPRHIGGDGFSVANPVGKG